MMWVLGTVGDEKCVLIRLAVSTQYTNLMDGRSLQLELP